MTIMLEGILASGVTFDGGNHILPDLPALPCDDAFAVKNDLQGYPAEVCGPPICGSNALVKRLVCRSGQDFRGLAKERNSVETFVAAVVYQPGNSGFFPL